MYRLKKSVKTVMLDIHTHFLPQMDDGPKSVNESKQMLRESLSQGVDICVATPHCIIHKSTDITDFIDRRNERYSCLTEELEADRLAYPEIKLGAEVYLDNDISGYEDVKSVCIGNSPYMLIELPRHIKTALLSEWIYNLCLKGIKPVIAHIDRYVNWKELVSELGNEEIIYQVNASRFLSFRGRRFISRFYKYSGMFLVSSDMHNMSSRKCNMQRAYEIALKRYGSSAYEMFGNTAKKIIENKDLVKL